MLNKQINELPPTTILTDVDLLVTDRFLGSGYYGTRSISLKNFKDTVTYPPPYDIGTVVSGSIEVLYSDGFLQKAIIAGNCSLNVPPDGIEGKHMEFIFTTDGSDHLLNFSGSYGRAADVVVSFPVTLKANTVTVVQTYKTATAWIITHIGTNTNLLSYTCSDLKTLISNNSLISGKYYRISDFQLMWNDATTVDIGVGTTVRSSGVVEPLVVLATSSNTISSVAYSELNPNDVIYYDINATYSVGWGTDTTAIPNFKGWIYRRIDVVNNIDIGWDWRYIKTSCYKYNFSVVPDWNSGTTYQKFEPNLTTPDYTCLVKYSGKLYYSLTGTGNVNKNPSTQTAYWAPVSGFNETDTYYAYVGTNLSILAGGYSFTVNSNSIILQPTFVSSLTSESSLSVSNVKNVKIESGYNNVIIGNSFYSNKIGTKFYGNTISSSFYYNSVGDEFYSNSIGGNFISNIVGNVFYKNITSGSVVYNKIGTTFAQNSIGDTFSSNVIQYGFIFNVIGSLFASNMVGPSFTYNTVGSVFDSNTIRTGMDSNTISSNFYSNTIGDYFISNTIGNNFRNNYVDNNIESKDFSAATHVYNSYNCTIFVAVDTIWLSYYGTGGVLITASPTS